MALQFADKWGCEVHAFTTSDDKRAETHKLGAHYVHNTKQEDALKKLAAGLDLIISMINVPLDVPGLLETPAPKGRLYVVGRCSSRWKYPRITGQKVISGSPTGSPTAFDEMRAFCARHSIAPVTEMFPMSQVNDAFEHLRSGKARYHIVLVNE